MLNDVIKQVAVKLDPDQAQESQQQHQIVVRPQVKIASFYSSFLVLSRSYLALDLKGKHFNFLGTTTSGSGTNLDETGDGRTNLRPGTGCEKTHHSGQPGGQ